MNGRAKNWTFTINNPLDATYPREIVAPMVYMFYGVEHAPTTNTTHLQGFVCFSERQRLTQVKILFPTAHLEVMKGTIAQNITYCSKDGDTHQLGERPTVTQGKRTELMDAIAIIEDGGTLSDVALSNPCTFVRCFKGLRELDNIRYEPAVRTLRVFVFHGPTGCGKTRWAYDHYLAVDVYKLNMNTNGTLWFDGYDRQPVLLIDDFTGWIKFRDLLTLLDFYPYRCQLKGSSTWARWDTVIITSEHPHEQWYNRFDGDITQLTRRITQQYDFGVSIPTTI